MILGAILKLNYSSYKDTEMRIMKIKNNRLIVVLGMHRSGTSVITRSLQIMGVGLGDRLMPPVEGNNAKGFWEDVDLNALNIEMLNTVDSDWFYVQAIKSIDIEILHKQGYFLRAVELLREKVSSSAIFAFKDPRVAKLLPFWKDAFTHCNLDVDYVLAVRNPLSVVKSLMKRDALDAEQSYLLWLSYVITSLTYSAGKKRVFVDYDRLIKSPDNELNRVVKYLDLEINPTELQKFKTEFLDKDLRHTLYNPSDLLLDEACPPLVREIYAVLLDVASDNVSFDELDSKVANWATELDRLKSPLMLIDKLFVQKVVAMNAVSERDAQIVSLTQALASKKADIDNYIQQLQDRQYQLDTLLSSISWRLTTPLRNIAKMMRKKNRNLK